MIPYVRETLVKHSERRIVGYDQALALVKHCEAAIMREAPDVLVGVLRGGVIPALMLSQRVDVPVVFCACNRGDAQAVFAERVDFTGQRVLIVDDFATTGQTLARTKAAVERLGGTCRTMAIFYDAQIRTKPDHGHVAQQFIHFVWDKLEVTPASRRLFGTHNSRYAPSTVTEHYGFDLDGMLLRACGGADPQPAVAQVLRKGAETSVFVSARRPSEFEAQRLAAWGLAAFERVHAAAVDEATDSDAAQADPIAFKVAQIKQLGISTWYEGDVDQALRIAQACPVTDVVLWSARGPLRLSVADAADI